MERRERERDAGQQLAYDANPCGHHHRRSLTFAALFTLFLSLSLRLPYSMKRIEESARLARGEKEICDRFSSCRRSSSRVISVEARRDANDKGKQIEREKRRTSDLQADTRFLAEKKTKLIPMLIACKEETLFCRRNSEGRSRRCTHDSRFTVRRSVTCSGSKRSPAQDAEHTSCRIDSR